MFFLTLLVGGALLGLGIYVALRQLLPSQPHLTSALERLHTSPLSAVQSLPAGQGNSRIVQRASREAATAEIRDRLGARLAHLLRNVSALQPPHQELRMLGTTTNEWYGEKGVWALLGLLSPALAYLVSALYSLALGINSLLPLELPLLVGPVAAAAAWFFPDLQLRDRVSKARAEFSRAVAAYIEFVALERRVGYGAEQALTNAAAVAKSWPFQRIHQQLLRCAWSGIRPWVGLNELSAEMGVPELAELAETMQLTDDEGVDAYEALRARAASLRQVQVNVSQTEANAATERINALLGLLVMMFAIFIIGPMILQVTL